MCPGLIDGAMLGASWTQDQHVAHRRRSHIVRIGAKSRQMNDGTTVKQLIAQLSNRASTKRQSAAKKLRKLKAKEAGPALLISLKKEIRDKRTWETQYQMAMALGESCYTESLEFLLELSEQELEAPMVYIAIGDAIARLTYFKNGSITGVLSFLDSKSDTPLLINGLLRAIALLRLTPSSNDIDQIISYGNKPEIDGNHRTWIASAAAGWHGSSVELFLNRCVISGNPQTKRAAEAALNKKYPKWDIL